MRAAIFLLVLLSSYGMAFGQLRLERAFPKLTFPNPVDIETLDGNSNAIFVASQQGLIYTFRNSQSASRSDVFLDITDRVKFSPEEGILAIAFHPLYRQNGQFFVYYCARNPRRTVLSRFTVDGTDPQQAVKESELVLLEIDQPYADNNGGGLEFGPDGLLYIGVGDGGALDDPLNAAQNLTSPLGKILRIDVDTPAPAKNYSIPVGNPYAGNDRGYMEEIFAVGLRNPTRFSFDAPTGRFWCTDVGETRYEEINLIQKARNYGWSIMEGSVCNNPPFNCNEAGLVKPVFEYHHGNETGFSIVGGFVYRGQRYPQLYGKYLFGDFVTSRVWELTPRRSLPVQAGVLIEDANLSITAFGTDSSGEIYLLGLGGEIYRFSSRTEVASTSHYVPPKTVSETPRTNNYTKKPPKKEEELTAPELLTAEGQPGLVLLRWRPTTRQEDGFIIERREEGGTFAVLDSAGGGVAVYSDASIEDSLTMQYRVSAYRGDKTSGYSNIAGAMALEEEKLKSFDLNVGDFKVTVDWAYESQAKRNFELWRLKEGEWETLTILPSNNEGIYSYNDEFKDTFSGILYYKLKIIHPDGDFEFTDPKRVEVNFERADVNPIHILVIFLALIVALSLMLFRKKSIPAVK